MKPGLRSTANSQRLERGCRMIFAGVPACLLFEIRGRSCSNFLFVGEQCEIVRPPAQMAHGLAVFIGMLNADSVRAASG